MITGRQRVWAAFNGGPSDRPPKGEILITPEMCQEFPIPDLGSILAYLAADLVVLPVGGNPDWQPWFNSDYFVFALSSGPLTETSGKLGWYNFSRMLVKSPNELKELFAKHLNNSIRSITKTLDAGCDGIILADDLAGARGPLISPVFLAESYFPMLKAMLEEIGCRQVPWVFHSDGNILGQIDLIKEAGFWGIHGLQPTAGLKPEHFHREGLANWVFWGNFEFEGQARLKTKEEVKLEVQNLLFNWSDFPGYIFGSSGGLYKGLAPGAVKAAYDSVAAWSHKR